MRDDEFERLYAAEAGPLFSFLAYRTGDRALAEDLLADAFERALRARRRFDRRKASEKTWLYAIALNCLRDHARRQAAESRAMSRAAGEREAATEAGVAGVEHRDLVQRALATLTAEERDAIALRDHARRQAAESRAMSRAAGEPEAATEAGVAGVEYRDLVQRALATLSAEERDAIALRFGAELSVPEIAELLGEPLTTVEGRVYRALRKLRDRLRDD